MTSQIILKKSLNSILVMFPSCTVHKAAMVENVLVRIVIWRWTHGSSWRDLPKYFSKLWLWCKVGTIPVFRIAVEKSTWKQINVEKLWVVFLTYTLHTKLWKEFYITLTLYTFLLKFELELVQHDDKFKHFLPFLYLGDCSIILFFKNICIF